MTVYLSEYIYPEAVKKLKEHATVVDNFDHIEEIDAIILRNIPVTAEMMDRAKKLKVIAKHGIGCNTIDVEAAKARGIQVIYTPTANADSVAEMTVGLFLMMERRLYEANVKCRNSEFKTIAPRDFLGTEIRGKTFGQIGMGNIAQRIAHIMSAGFGVKVPALGRTVHRDRALGTFFGAERAVHAGGGVIDRLAAGFARLRCGRRGAGEGLAALLGTGGGVARHNRQALFRADIGAVAALYAVEPVDGPGACRAVHSQRAGRAAARA